MKRKLPVVLGIMMFALAVPSAALAHHGHRHHKAHAKAHHAKFRLVHIGALGLSTPATPATPATATTPVTPPAPENAGKVTSYLNGVLTLTLNDGSPVSGKITSGTEIGCIKAAPPSPGTEGQPTDQSPSDDNGQGDEQSSGDQQEEGEGQQGDRHSGDSQQGEESGDGEVTGGPEPPCDTSALVEGAVVRSAELRIGPGGREFEKVRLVR